LFLNGPFRNINAGFTKYTVNRGVASSSKMSIQIINLYGNISPRKLESSPTPLQALQDVMSGNALHAFIA
jgi:hypothetical protein